MAAYRRVDDLPLHLTAMYKDKEFLIRFLKISVTLVVAGGSWPATPLRVSTLTLQCDCCIYKPMAKAVGVGEGNVIEHVFHYYSPPVNAPMLLSLFF